MGSAFLVLVKAGQPPGVKEKIVVVVQPHPTIAAVADSWWLHGTGGLTDAVLLLVGDNKHGAHTPRRRAPALARRGGGGVGGWQRHQVLQSRRIGQRSRLGRRRSGKRIDRRLLRAIGR